MAKISRGAGPSDVYDPSLPPHDEDALNVAGVPEDQRGADRAAQEALDRSDPDTAPAPELANRGELSAQERAAAGGIGRTDPDANTRDADSADDGRQAGDSLSMEADSADDRSQRGGQRSSGLHGTARSRPQGTSR